ncbi:CAS/CSE protein involved in chromosome segregation [Mycobacteroides abscessus subsp. abscessus]|nr:CAS/CSE protein involved in chromosome segregation [Mycobacteroides abscessus subsp. abscessus]
MLWSGLPEPIDIELDLKAGVIYWTDRGAAPLGNTLNKAQIPASGQAGGEVTVLASGFAEAIGLAVDKEAGIAYVSDMSGEIRAVNLDGSGERTFAKVDGNLTGIVGV